MLTKGQYIFLKKFIKLAKKSKKSCNQLSFFNREKVSVNDFVKLVMSYPELYPPEPLTQRNIEIEHLSDGFLLSYINDIYLENIGLKDCFVFCEPNKYGISSLGLKELEEYKINKINKIRLPILAIGVSSAALIVSIISLVKSFI